MKTVKLFEEFVNETKIVDKDINNSIAEFYSLQEQITDLEEELKRKKAAYKEFDTAIKPMIDGMKKTGDKLATTEKFIVKVERFGYEKENPSYKDAFNLSLTKVNTATKKILEEALESSVKVSNISHTYSIETNEANLFQKIGNFFKDIVEGFKKIFNIQTRVIDAGNKELEQLVLHAFNLGHK
jgi:DNA-binding protein YbaB